MERYNKLEVIKVLDSHILPSGQKKKKVLCKCDCGNIKSILYEHIKSGNIKSCGCLKKELLIKRNTTHNLRYSNAYGSYKKMKRRCLVTTDKDYPNWGGRGIKICDRWLNSFQNFYDDMGEREKGYTIDRINTNGNYEPTNCRWVSRSENSKNKRF
jgi:hypothetical protein